MVNSKINRFSLYALKRQGALLASDPISLVRSQGSFAEIFKKKEHGIFLLDCLQPTNVEMRALSRAFVIRPLTVEEIQTQDARIKLEAFKNYTFVTFHSFGDDLISFYILIFANCILSFHFEPVAHCLLVDRGMRRLHGYTQITSEWIAYALIDAITDSFASRMRKVEDEADFIEHCVYMNLEGETETPLLLQRIGEGRKNAIYLPRMISGKPGVVRALWSKLWSVTKPARRRSTWETCLIT